MRDISLNIYSVFWKHRDAFFVLQTDGQCKRIRVRRSQRRVNRSVNFHSVLERERVSNESISERDLLQSMAPLEEKYRTD